MALDTGLVSGGSLPAHRYLEDIRASTPSAIQEAVQASKDSVSISPHPGNGGLST